MFDMKVFGQRLLELRKKKGITQSVLANLLKITCSQVSDMEKGNSGTSLTRLVQLAEFYHVSTDYLLGVTDDPAWRGK